MEFDAAVVAAYGWPADISEEGALARLFALIKSEPRRKASSLRTATTMIRCLKLPPKGSRRVVRGKAMQLRKRRRPKHAKAPFTEGQHFTVTLRDRSRGMMAHE